MLRRRDLLERPVVAGCDERVVDRRVEPSFGPRPRVEREVDHGEQVVAGLEASCAVERRKLGFGTKAREQRLDPLELALGGFERRLGRGPGFGGEEEGDIGAHRAEAAALDHEVLVIVTGGRVTTRTEGAAQYPEAGVEYDEARLADARAAASCRW